MTSKGHPGKTEWAGKKHIQTCPSFDQHSSIGSYRPQEKIQISSHVCQALHEVVSAHLSHSSPFSTQFLFLGVWTSLLSFMSLEWDISHSLRPQLHQEASVVRVTAHRRTPERCWAVRAEQPGEHLAGGEWEGVGGRRAEVKWVVAITEGFVDSSEAITKNELGARSRLLVWLRILLVSGE